MLQKFRVSNFKGFNETFELDLTEVNGYEFNKISIKNGIVNNALIYGHNGVGKSNLAFAIFDIVGNLTDKQMNELVYNNYLNAFNESSKAKFYFEFFINSKIVKYEYHKTDYKKIIYERILIDDKELAIFDREKDSGARINFEGAENLNTELTNTELSILKYIKNNSNLHENEANRTFLLFFTFVERMLYFRSLMDKTYMGSEVRPKDILEDIIEKQNVLNFETFLNAAGIECKLEVAKILNKKTIVFDFKGKQLKFEEVASTGTNALTLFYYWFQRVKESEKVSFLYIDEFDAFYHHALSSMIVDQLKNCGVQFILTTHNTSIISNDLLRPDCYFLMTKQKIRSLSNATPKELREAHNIEKMYKAGAFNVQ